MIKTFLKALLGFIFVVAVGAWLFWPDTWVVKGPMFDFITGRQVEAPSKGTIQARFKLPDGFQVGVFASGVENARMMRVTPAGDLLVSSMRPGEVILLHRDDDNDGVADGRTVLLSGLDLPHGLALKDGYLYIAETGRIVRVAFDFDARTVGAVESVFEGLPPGGNHRTRTIGFGPDGWLYVTIGSTCNVCIEDHPYRSTMLRMREDGSQMSIFATGLRNTVGFDWQPGSGRLYGTDNGRDLLGDDIPHCELNLIEEGGDYGWPYAYENKVADPDFGPGNEDKVAASRPMAHGLGAHVAPLGMRFLQPDLVETGYEATALVALHGSWNRSELSGYKVVALDFAADGSIQERDFLTGFEFDEDVVGRPVDIEQGPDGAIYISDDYAGAIYRVGYGTLPVAGFTSEIAQSSLAEADFAAADIDAGRLLYEQNGCAACHDPEVAPEGVQVKLLKGLAARFDQASMAALLNAPPGPMPRPELTDEDRLQLAAYLLSTMSQ